MYRSGSHPNGMFDMLVHALVHMICHALVGMVMLRIG
jgi:hypothetical protein